MMHTVGSYCEDGSNKNVAIHSPCAAAESDCSLCVELTSGGKIVHVSFSISSNHHPLAANLVLLLSLGFNFCKNFA
jgi:hypothetical protein